MPPTPPSEKDDILDLGDLDMTPSGAKSKAAAAESDFEKELEALFAEELASSDETPASAPPVGAPDLEEDILSLDDLVEDAPAATAAAPAADAGDDDILDLGDFAADGPLDITPPEEVAGGKDGGIDTSGLDDLISGLGDLQKPAPAQEPEPADLPLDSTDMADLLESIDVPEAKKPAAPGLDAEISLPGLDADEPMELSLGDLVDEPQAVAAEPEPAVGPAGKPEAEPALDLGDLDLTLPDLSDPEPGRDLVAEQEQADLGGELNLSLGDLAEDTALGADDVEQILDAGDLDMTGLVEVAPAEPEPAEADAEAEPSLGAEELLAQIPEEPAPAAPAEPAIEPIIEPVVAASVAAAAVATAQPATPVMPMADAALAAAAATEPAPVAEAALRAQLEQANSMLAELKARFADLTTQVTGGGVALMRLEGRLAEKDQALAEMESALKASQSEASMLRTDLADLRGQLEETLRVRAQEAEEAGKDATALKERLALVEDRQAQLDSEVHTEISRAVPREAARIIREEIAALAASMRDE
jgi:pilus assembly protein FimV